MRDFLDSFDFLDIRNVLDRGRQARMNAEDTIFDDCSDREIVEQVCEELPNRGRAVLSLTLRIETIHLSDLSCLMVAS